MRERSSTGTSVKKTIAITVLELLLLVILMMMMMIMIMMRKKSTVIVGVGERKVEAVGVHVVVVGTTCYNIVRF